MDASRRALESTMAGLSHGRLPALRRRLGDAWPTDRVSTGLGLFGLVFILAMTGAIAWKTYAGTDRQVRDHARRGAAFLADHAGRLFEVTDIALRATTIALAEDDWPTIETSQRLRAEMKATAAALPYVEDIWLNDQDGRLRLTTFVFPTPVSSIADRPIFKTLLQNPHDLVIGEPIVGKVTGVQTFLIAHSIAWPDGRFRGIVSATTDLGYFSSYWRGLDLPYGERVALLRGGRGDMLVGYPEGAFATAEFPDLTIAIAQHRDVGTFRAAPGETGFYRRVGTMPLYLAVIVDDDESVRDWTAWFLRFMPFPLAAILAVLAAIVLNLRRVRAEALARQAIEAARHELSLSNLRLEERVAERTASLRETNAEIQRFAYIVSHDLRAPLVNITGFTAELQMMRADLFAPAARADTQLVKDFDEAIGFIRTSIDKMDRLIRAILLLSRQGQRAVEPEPVDMNRLMRAVADGVAHQAQHSGATIAIGPLPCLTSDPIGLEQIFSNLVDNAVKYLRPGVPGLIEITGEQREGEAIFTIRDNGRGIDPRDHARVFDLFRRAGPQDQPGEGIGLAHVRALVRRLGGAIRLDSTPGGGSTFTVIFPIAGFKDPS